MLCNAAALLQRSIRPVKRTSDPARPGESYLKRVYVVGTADTKGEELSYLRDRVAAEGAVPVLVDVGIRQPKIPVDIAAEEIAARHPDGAGAVLGLVRMFAFFPLLETRQPALIVLAIVVALTVHAMMYGPQAAFIAEQFPTRVRYAGASLAYTLAGIVGGGIAPMVSTALLQSFGTPLAVSSYAALALLITCVVLLIVRERARDQLD